MSYDSQLAAHQPKVADLQAAVGVQQKVAGLEVPVDDVGAVDVLERHQHLQQKDKEVRRMRIINT